MRISIDGTIVQDVTLKEPASHFKPLAGTSLDEESGNLFVNVVHLSALPQKTTIKRSANSSLCTRSTALPPTGNDPFPEATHAEPFKLAPVESVSSQPDDGTNEFKHLFPPCSVAVLHLGQNL